MTNPFKASTTVWAQWIQLVCIILARGIVAIYVAGVVVGELVFNYWQPVFVLLGRTPAFAGETK